MSTPALSEIMHPTWADALADAEPNIRAMGDFLRAELAAGRRYQPAGANVFRALRTPLPDVKVLLVGQDPYPTPGHAVGLSFAVPPELQPLPRSLINIGQELATDIGGTLPADLSQWADEGVLMLNRVLTVRPGTPGSHRGKGWEAVTERVVRVLAERGGPLVAVLWGRDAGNLRPLLPGVPVVASAHPSPLSAQRGFFGSRPFSRVNELLAQQGAAPVNWSGTPVSDESAGAAPPSGGQDGGGRPDAAWASGGPQDGTPASGTTDDDAGEGGQWTLA